MCNMSDQNKLKYDVLMHEYDKLREEILHHASNINRTNQIMAGIICASIGVLIGKFELITAIAPFIIILVVTVALRSSFILFINSRHLRQLEHKLNEDFDSPILTWESNTCKKIFSKQFALHNPLFLVNVIIFSIMLGTFILCLISGYHYLKDLCPLWAKIYLGALISYGLILLFYGISFSIYLKPGGKIEKIISNNQGKAGNNK